jgi:hypothetical protein
MANVLLLLVVVLAESFPWAKSCGGLRSRRPHLANDAWRTPYST